MSELDARDPLVLRSYEGLVFTTASQLAATLANRGTVTADDDLDDLMQLLRMKVFYALRRFDYAKAKKKGEARAAARDRYVFMCLQDTKKDVIKKKRTLTLMIEDVAPNGWSIGADGERPRDSFDMRYLSQTHDETYAGVEAAMPLIPNTLSELERGVLTLLYRDYSHREIAERLGVSRGEVSSAVRALRAKLADWKPPTPEAAPSEPTATRPPSRSSDSNRNFRSKGESPTGLSPLGRL